jgi:transposase-like protein
LANRGLRVKLVRQRRKNQEEKMKRNWSAEQKTAIVLEGLRGESSVAELCRQHGISSAMYYQWRDRFLEAGKAGLSGKGANLNGEMALRSKLKELERIIGRLTVQNEILKKTEELLGR